MAGGRKRERAAKDGLTSAWSSCDDGIYYTPEQVEFLKAISNYKTMRQRPHPSWGEVLAVVRSLGYRKVADIDTAFFNGWTPDAQQQIS